MSPQNWPLWKRNTIFFVVCLTALAATNTILANAAGLVIQAHEFQKSAQDLSYTVSQLILGSPPWQRVLNSLSVKRHTSWSCRRPVRLATVCSKIWQGVDNLHREQSSLDLQYLGSRMQKQKFIRFLYWSSYHVWLCE
jgi:hypothetical protein